MTKVDSIELCDESASEAFASQLALYLRPPLVLTFSGEIGAGKTTFIRAMLRALGIRAAIKSPTFSLIETYDCNNMQIHHFDLYRIHDESELEYIGFRDYFVDKAVCCIEWPERAMHKLEHVDVNFTFTVRGSGRLLVVSALSVVGEIMMTSLRGAL